MCARLRAGPLGVLLTAMTALAGCQRVAGTWHDSWQAARTPERPLRLAGAQIPLELVESWAKQCPNVPFEVDRVGKVRFSHDGFRALVKGQANVACTSARMPWYDAKDYRDAHGHLPRGWRIAWDACAVYVHPDNPVKQITIKHFKELLRGQIKSWSTLGGPTEPINLYGPPRHSRAGGVFYRVAKLFIADPPWKELARPEDVVQAVSDDPLALGLTVVGYAETAPYLALKGTFDPVPRVPDFYTLEADKWPLLKTIWVWTSDPPDQAAADLIDWLYSPRGQAVIKSTGYTPIPRDRGETRIVPPEPAATRATTQP